MTTPKQEVKKIIDSLPEDASYEEIIKELAFDRMIQSENANNFK
jgi:poly-D-alanine transfer protein DltD